MVGRCRCGLEPDVTRTGDFPGPGYSAGVSPVSSAAAGGASSAASAGAAALGSLGHHVGHCLGGSLGHGVGAGIGHRLGVRVGALLGLLLERRADVVALLVVGVLAEVLLVLGGDLATLGGLLDRQRDAPAVEVDVDDLHPELFARGDDLLGRLDVVRRHLGDVHQTLDAFADLHERAERHELGDPAVDELADLVAVGELLPRVLLRGLERQRDALAARGRRRAPAR